MNQLNQCQKLRSGRAALHVCNWVYRRRLVELRDRPHIQSMTSLTVWYDGGCLLCRREIALMRRLDVHRAIQFVDVSDGAESCPIDRRQLLTRFHASEDGIVVSGAAAFAAMWRAIPLLRPLGLIARSPFVLRLLERAYLGFLRVRPILQRLAGGRASA